MPAYRFCRPDDIPMLVQAVNSCCLIHQPGAAPYTVAQFKHEMRVIDLWPSSCMIALAGDKPIAVLTGCKRKTETRIIRLGVCPSELRRGHGTHLVDSLSKKLAVLGPPRILIHAPVEDLILSSFLTKNHYLSETTLTSWRRTLPVATLADSAAVGPVSLADAQSLLLEAPEESLAWDRQTKSLADSVDEIQGIGIASPDALEAALFYLEADAAISLIRFGCRTPQAQAMLFQALLLRLPNPHQKPLEIPQVAEAELGAATLAASGFAPYETTTRWITQARAG